MAADLALPPPEAIEAAVRAALDAEERRQRAPR